MTNLVAAFPMYQRAELSAAFDALWCATRDRLRAKGIAAPDALTVVEGDLLSFWHRPELLLSQTCGLPFRHVLKDRVVLVGTPDFGVEDCPPGHCRSAIVVRRDDLRAHLKDFDGATFACNDVHSQSGYAAPLVAAQKAGVRLGTLRISGAHVNSARMVATGQADFAGIDAVSWRHMLAFDAWVAGLRVLGWTDPSPGLPFITANASLAPTLALCLSDAIRSMPGEMLTRLTLKGLTQIDADDYLSVPDPPAWNATGSFH